MKATEQYFPVVLFVMLYKVVLVFESVDEILQCNLSNESYFCCTSLWYCLLCCKWCFQLLDKIIEYDSGGSRIFFRRGALVSCSTSTPINHIVFSFFDRIPVILENRRSSGGGRGAHPLHPPPRSAPVWVFKWNPFTRFFCLILRFSILQYETRNFSWTSRGTKSTFKIETCPIKVHRVFSLWEAEEGGARETMVTNE